MKNNLTIRDCNEIKNVLLETLEKLDELITIKELQENYEHKSPSECAQHKFALDNFIDSVKILNSYFEGANEIETLTIERVKTLVNFISACDKHIDYFSKEIEEAANDNDLRILLPNLQDCLTERINRRDYYFKQLLEVFR